MWTGQCEDCKNWEQENSDLRQRIRDKETTILEVEERLDSMLRKMKAWELTLAEVSLEILEAEKP